MRCEARCRSASKPSSRDGRGFGWSNGLPLAAEEKVARVVQQERGRLMRDKSELRSYQNRVADWLYERDSAIAVLDLGAGKTAATLTAIKDLIDDAEKAGRLTLMALHPASAGHGLNLQAGGHHLAWLGLTWSAELYQQTLKRIHRPGQKQRVTVHICLAEATVDETKRDRVIDKQSAQEAFQRHLQRI